MKEKETKRRGERGRKKEKEIGNLTVGTLQDMWGVVASLPAFNSLGQNYEKENMKEGNKEPK